MMNDDVLIFSPHCDDVPLSIGGAILGGALGKRVRIEVVFSTSCYSLTHSLNADANEVTRIRHEEERAAAELAGYEVNFMGYPEPFVRPGYGNMREVFDPGRRLQDDPIWPSVNAAICSRVSASTGLVLWPMRCGHHIDHRMVFESLTEECKRTSRPCIGVYEDLPYATRLLDEEISSLIPDLPVGPLTPVTVASIPFDSKAALLDKYPSQLKHEDIELVFIHWIRRGGERLWLSPAAIDAYALGDHA